MSGASKKKTPYPPPPPPNTVDLLCSKRHDVDVVLMDKEGDKAVVLEEKVGFVVDGHPCRLLTSGKHFAADVKYALKS